MKVTRLIKHCSFFSLAVFGIANIASAAQVLSLRQMQENGSGAALLNNMSKSSDTSFKIINAEKNKGSSYEKMQQYFRGVPVLDQIAVRVTDVSGKITRLHGYVAQQIENDVTTVTPKFSSDEAFAEAKASHLKTVKEAVELNYENIQKKLVIFIDENQKAHLAYLVMFNVDSENGGHAARPRVIVDALSNEVLSYMNALAYDHADITGNGGNKKTGKYFYGQQFPKLSGSSEGSTCKMQTENVTTIDLHNLGNGQGNDTNLPTDPFQFSCFDHQEAEVNGAYSQINDAHFYGTEVFKMYMEWFGQNPLNTSLTLRVHYAKDFENAFWDGKQMTFGDGKDMFYPLAVMDVTAHEISHGFTEFNSNLTYTNQSGGINEAFSDIAGEAMEFYARGHNDFLVGAEIAKSMEALRYFADPKKDGASIDNVKDFKWRGDTICQVCSMIGGCPSMCTDVHHSSGIYNKAFYLIATAADWNTKKAFEIFVRANKKYWTATTNFKDGAAGVVDAAKDLNYDTAPVKAAFKQVGIDL